MRNHSYENDFDLLENETTCRTYFHMEGFTLRLILKQRLKRTWKWPIEPEESSNNLVCSQCDMVANLVV